MLICCPSHDISVPVGDTPKTANNTFFLSIHAHQHMAIDALLTLNDYDNDNYNDN